jgi:hypothetical protein
MSRRHQGGRPHRSNGHARNPLAPLTAAPPDPQRPRPEPAPPPPSPIAAEPFVPAVSGPGPDQAEPGAQLVSGSVLTESANHGAPLGRGSNGGDPTRVNGSAGCTAPQLRRFIKSRPYVPMHELRRRFGINGAEDDVTPVETADGRVFVGLPAREGSLLGELLRGGEVGFELSLDPRTPIVVGLYPMRPIPRS